MSGEGITGIELHETRTVTAEVSGKADMPWVYHKNSLRPDRITVVFEREGGSPWLVTGIEVGGARVLISGRVSTNAWQRGANSHTEAWTATPDHVRRKARSVTNGIPEWASVFADEWCTAFNAGTSPA